MYTEIVKLSQDFMRARVKSYERYFIRNISPQHRFTIILGERGVGKTTTIIQYLLKSVVGDFYSDKILYVQTDHFLLGNTSLYEIAEKFDQLGGETIAFDEIHKYPNWSVELKSIYDTFPNLKIFASGSSALEIYKGSHDLSRRSIVYRMFGQSLREFIELKLEINMQCFSLEQILSNHEKLATDVIKLVASLQLKILPLFKEYLQYGYYPYYFENMSNREYWLTLEQNIHTTIESDLSVVHPSLTGHTISKIKLLIAYIAKSVPFTPNWSKLKSIIGVADDRTLKNYVKYLKDAGLIQTILSTSHKLKGLEEAEKIYLSNPNQLYAVHRDGTNIGTVRETFFASMLTFNHQLSLAKQGDFWVDDKYLIEVGGKNKGLKQIQGKNEAYLAVDNIENGVQHKIPLWLFGFLY